MKTINWQTKALTLFIAAVAFCLTAACGSADTTYYPYPEGGLRIVSSDTCEIELPLAPSQEFADLPERMRQRMENDPNFAYTSMNLDIKTRRESRYTRLGPEFRRIWNGFYAYERQATEVSLLLTCLCGGTVNLGWCAYGQNSCRNPPRAYGGPAHNSIGIQDSELHCGSPGAYRRRQPLNLF